MIFQASQVATGYGVCVYILYDHRAIFERTLNGLILINRTEAVRRLHGHRTISVQSSRSLRKLSTEIVRSPYGFRAETVRFFGQHFHRKSEVCYTIIARRPCDARAGIVQCPYDMSTGYGLTIFKNCITFLYKIVEATEPVNRRSVR